MKQKLYCYVDESGQDDKSLFFVVVAVVSGQEQNNLRNQLLEIEQTARTGFRKWHKTRPERRLNYLRIILKQSIAKGDVFFGYFQKPLPYFMPMLETIERAVKMRAEDDYQLIVYIDGIDKKKAKELTNALRLRGIKLGMIRSARDESEPVIRLADMWAGCIRRALLGDATEVSFFERAKEVGYLRDIKK